MPVSLVRNDGLEELQILRAAVEASGDIVYSWDLATDQIEWLGQATQILDLCGGDLPPNGDRFNGRISPEDLPARMHALSEHFAGTAPYDCEYRVRAGDGEFHWVHDRGAVELSSGGTPTRLCGTLRFVTQRKENEERLEQLANFDELTGHFNKLRLREALDHALAYSHRYEQAGAFLVVGVDQLDRINTAYGYEVGDRALVEVAQRLDRCVRGTDVIGRLGSDRFGVVLGGCPEIEALVIAERIIQTIRQNPISTEGERVHVTASIGLVCFPDRAKTSFDAIAKAEGALLKAKSVGRDCVHAYELSEEQRQIYRTSMEIGEEVTRALKEDRLVFSYQPIVDAASHEVNCYECLLRIKMADGSLIPAGKFVPVVEHLGMMRAIDRRVLDLVLKDLERYPDVVLSFNISGVTAADRGWLRAMVAQLKDRRDLATRMIVEITETAALHDLDDTARFISVLRDLGCRVAVDDFGAGFTTFKHLRALTVDVVKIDGFFVRNLATNHENQLFIRNLLSLAKAFNLITVAECVENVEDAAVLLREGVNLLQGWYFGKPQVAPVARAEEETVHGAGLTPTPAPVDEEPEAPVPEAERSIAV